MLLLNGLSHRLAPGQLLIQRALVEVLAEQAPGAAAARRPPTACRPAPTRRRSSRRCAGCSGRCRSWTSARGASARPSRCGCRRRRRSSCSAHPDAIKTIFTGDEEDLRAGEANFRLAPILGQHSLLLLDGQEHLRERRLLQPPFHGDRMLAYGPVMRDIAARAVERWPLGRPFAVHPEMQGITLDVILRTVFGLDEGPAKRELRAAMIELLDARLEPAAAAGGAAVERQPGGRGRPLLRGARARRPAALRRDRRAPPGRRDRPRRHPVAAGPGALRRRPAARGPGAARRADDDAARRPRDHGDGARLGGEPRAGATATCARGCSTSCAARPAPLDPQRTTRLEYLDAVCRETLRLTPIVPAGGPAPHPPDDDRRHRPARRRGGGAVHLPGPPPPRALARARALPARAVPRDEADAVRVPALRRRRAPLPRDGVRAASR